MTIAQDEWLKVGTDCPLCKADFKMAARPQAGYREDLEENFEGRNIDSHDAAMIHHAASAPPHSRNVFDYDGYEEPPALPSSSSSSRPLRYATGHAIGHDSADLDLASSRGDAVPAPPPRSRRGSRRSSAADIYDAPAEEMGPIRELAPIRELGRVAARRSSAADIYDAPAEADAPIRELGRLVAVRPSRVRVPGLQARSSGGAALSPPAVAADMNGAVSAPSAASALLIGGVRGVVPSRGGRGTQQESPRDEQIIQQASSAAYNTSPLDQIRPSRRENSVPRAQNRTDQA